MKKARLDRVLVDRAIYPTREQAQRAVMAGQVRVGGQVADKASLLVDSTTVIATVSPPRYVGRGGLKLDGALDSFHLDVRDWIAIDIGASTGGFTDCLLQLALGKFTQSTLDMGSWPGKFGTMSEWKYWKRQMPGICLPF